MSCLNLNNGSLKKEVKSQKRNVNYEKRLEIEEKKIVYQLAYEYEMKGIEIDSIINNVWEIGFSNQTYYRIDDIQIMEQKRDNYFEKAKELRLEMVENIANRK